MDDDIVTAETPSDTPRTPTNGVGRRTTAECYATPSSWADNIDLKKSILTTVQHKLTGEYGPQGHKLRNRRLIFILFVCTEMMTNFDSGALATLIGDADSEPSAMILEFKMSATEQGLLAGLVYLGHVLGSFITCKLLHNYRAKHVLAVSMLLDTAAAALFAWSPYKNGLFFAKFLMGACTAPIVVYAPVWVDDFAPPERQTLWMSLVQGGVALGVVLGYCCAGLFQANAPDMSWRWPFYIQTVALGLIAFIIALVPSKLINQPLVQVIRTQSVLAGTDEEASDGTDSEDGKSGSTDTLPDMPSPAPSSPVLMNRKTKYDKPPSLGMQAWNIAKNPLYVSTSFALTSLYFVVTGLQIWVTAYLKGPLHQSSRNVVTVAFGFTSATGPILGVIVGGVALDYIGGYDSIANAAKVCAWSGMLAAACGWASIFMMDFWWFMVCIWFLLFFGGAVVPAATGLLITVVDPAEKHTAQSMAVALYNLLGYYMAPVSCGIVADHYGITWGMRLALGFSAVAMLFVVVTFFLARHMEKKQVVTGDAESVADAEAVTPRPTAQHANEQTPMITRSFVGTGKSFSKNDWLSALRPAPSLPHDTPRHQPEKLTGRVPGSLARSFAFPLTPGDDFTTPDHRNRNRSRTTMASCSPENAKAPTVRSEAPANVDDVLALSPRAQERLKDIVKNSTVIFKVEGADQE